MSPGAALERTVAAFWKQQDYSDVDLQFQTQSSSWSGGLGSSAATRRPAASRPATKIQQVSLLSKIPAHRMVLCSSSYFKAHVSTAPLSSKRSLSVALAPIDSNMQHTVYPVH